MTSWKRPLLSTAKTVYIVLVIIVLGYAVGFAAHGHVLVKIALPLSLVVILSLRFIGRAAELLAWAGMTLWLGMTYAHTGPPIEIVVFFLYVACAALGVFRSSWFLAIPWLAHIAWDFVPRALPEMFHELPHACALFDGPIGLYLCWYSWKQRWPVLGQQNAASIDHVAK